jgi:hypothetical protein
MKPTFAFAAIATLLAAPALAGENMALAEIDLNADGYVSIEEVKLHHPDVAAESFADWDVNGDAKLSEAEFSAWQKASSDGYGTVAIEDTADAGEAMTDDQ